MLKTAPALYCAFVTILGMSIVTIMFVFEPRMMIPSLIGIALFTAIIVFFFRIVSKKSETEQKYIAKRNGRLASVLVVILLMVFFSTAATHHNMLMMDFIRLWFGL